MKGQETRAQILESALELTSLEGLDAITIGRLAKTVGLSKSGLFAHFNSKEALQHSVLERAADQFISVVVRPALKKDRGLPRLRGMFDNWLRWATSGRLPGGCVFVGAAAELDDRPGPLRDYLVKTQRDWLQTLATAVRLAKAEGHLPDELKPDQVAFEIYGIMLSFHLYSRLLGDSRAKSRARAAFERLIDTE